MLWSPSGSLVVEAEELVGGSSSELADVFPRTIPPPGCGAEVLELAVAAKVLHSAVPPAVVECPGAGTGRLP